MSYLTTGGPVRNIELTKYHPMGELGKDQKERGDASSYVLPTSRNPSCWNPFWLSDAQATRKDPVIVMMRDNSETDPIPIKPETVSHVAEKISWAPYPPALHPGTPS